MSQDYRNDFLQSVKLMLMESADPEVIYSKIAVLLDKYELTERVTDLVPSDNENAELLKMYFSAIIIDGKAQTTIELYSHELKRFLMHFGGKHIKELTTFDVRSYLAKRKLDGISNRTLDTIRTIVSAFFGWLSDEEYIEKNPCKSIKPIKYQREMELPFSTVEMDKLRSVCKKYKERALLEFLLASGVRVTELCMLDVSDIDFMKNRVHIRHGKGDKERYTYLTDLAKEHLLKYLNGRTDGALFIPQRGDRYEKGGIRYVLRTLGKRCGVENVHPHRFRRTFATQLASRGMQVQEIQKLMGHSNINTTMVYVALSDADIQYAYKKFA